MQTKISVLGHFGEGVTLLNGQTVKTKIFTEELERQFGKEQVRRIDTHGGWKNLIKAPFQVFTALKKSENVVIFPAQNGLRVYAPLLSVLKKLFRKRKIHYAVIGGWLAHFLNGREGLAKALKNFDGIYTETNTMKTALEKQGFTNVYVMPNCKNLTVLSEDELIYPDSTPLKLCTFSRVMHEKGIEDAVNAVVAVNTESGSQSFSLDIYGQVDAEQTEWFDELKSKFPEYIRYCGCVDADKSVEVLKDYFALLFPTRFYTEGIPGTVIDAYAAGVPVVSARWESYSDIVCEGETGIGYDFGNEKQLEDILSEIVTNTRIISDMKTNCIVKAESYMPAKAVQVMINNFG